MMAALRNVVRNARTVQNITQILKNFSLLPSRVVKTTFVNIPLRFTSNTPAVEVDKKPAKVTESAVNISETQAGLREFFDDEKNWGQSRVRVGRAWTKDELRIKSNEDLHKLWYVLLKERNMLMTMEHVCKQAFELFPNPERIDKIAISMENLEHVVRERNRAYHLLETGEHGERPCKRVRNILGLSQRYNFAQHIIPKFMNKRWREKRIFHFEGSEVGEFLLKYREKIYLKKKLERTRANSEVKGILRRFPNVDHEAIKAKYPDVDIEKMLRIRRTRGHRINDN